MPYKRIVRLVPSLTELLFVLGISQGLVGKTGLSIHYLDSVKNI